MNRQAKIVIGVLAAACLALGGLLVLRSGVIAADRSDGPAVTSRLETRTQGRTGERRTTENRTERRAEERSWFERLTGPRMVTVTVPAGVAIPVRLETPIDSSEMRAGDRFEASLARDLVVDGRVLARAGAGASGRVIERDDSDRVKGRERLVIELVRLELAGDEREIGTEPVTLVAKGTKKRDAAIIGGSAAAGAIIGAITGGGDGAAKGAAIGGLGGTGVVLATPGEDIELPVGYQIRFALDEEIAVEVEDSGRTEAPSRDVSGR